MHAMIRTISPRSSTIFRSVPGCSAWQGAQRSFSSTRRSCEDAKSPSHKITAVPFMLDPESARMKMKQNALLSTITLSNAFYATALKFFGESVTPFLYEFGLGGNGLKHEKTRAVYWPIWRYSYMAEADLKLRNSSGPALFMFNNTSLPGNSFSPISLLDFTQPDLPEAMPVWDPTSDLKQLEGFDNMDISAVPFSVDPLKALDLVKRRLGRHVRLGGDRIDMERDVREKLFAAYPTYFPLYISEWSFKLNEDSKPRKITVVMNAHDSDPNNCRCAKPMIPGYGDRSNNYGYWMEMPHKVRSEEEILQISKVDPHQIVAESWVNWLNPAALKDNLVGEQDPRTGSLIAPSSPLAEIDVEENEIAWDDPRIQQQGGEEANENLEWMKASATRIAMEGQLARMKRAIDKAENSSGTAIRLDLKSGGGLPKFERIGLDDALKAAEKDSQKAHAEWEEQKPKWLSKWEAERRSITDESL